MLIESNKVSTCASTEQAQVVLLIAILEVETTRGEFWKCLL
jgi:hypothetical protein